MVTRSAFRGSSGFKQSSGVRAFRGETRSERAFEREAAMETKRRVRSPSKSNFVSSVVKAMREAGLRPRVDWKPDGSVSIVPVAEVRPESDAAPESENPWLAEIGGGS